MVVALGSCALCIIACVPTLTGVVRCTRRLLDFGGGRLGKKKVTHTSNGCAEVENFPNMFV
jgi:hypothetical protein